MKSRQEIQDILQMHLPQLRGRFHVQRLAIFGSWARGDQTAHSDVDILVSLGRPLGLEIVDLHEYLERLLGLKVDLVTEGAVIRKPLLWQSIQEDVIHVQREARAAAPVGNCAVHESPTNTRMRRSAIRVFVSHSWLARHVEDTGAIREQHGDGPATRLYQQIVSCADPC